MNKVIVNVRHLHSNLSSDLEIPCDISIYQLIDVVTSSFSWADSSIDETNHIAIVDIPGKEKRIAQLYETLSSLNVLDGTYIVIAPEDESYFQDNDDEATDTLEIDWELPK